MKKTVNYCISPGFHGGDYEPLDTYKQLYGGESKDVSAREAEAETGGGIPLRPGGISLAELAKFPPSYLENAEDLLWIGVPRKRLKYREHWALPQLRGTTESYIFQVATPLHCRWPVRMIITHPSKFLMDYIRMVNPFGLEQIMVTHRGIEGFLMTALRTARPRTRFSYGPLYEGHITFKPMKYAPRFMKDADTLEGVWTPLPSPDVPSSTEHDRQLIYGATNRMDWSSVRPAPEGAKEPEPKPEPKREERVMFPKILGDGTEDLDAAQLTAHLDAWLLQEVERQNPRQGELAIRTVTVPEIFERYLSPDVGVTLEEYAAVVRRLLTAARE